MEGDAVDASVVYHVYCVILEWVGKEATMLFRHHVNEGLKWSFFLLKLMLWKTEANLLASGTNSRMLWSIQFWKFKCCLLKDATLVWKFKPSPWHENDIWYAHDLLGLKNSSWCRWELAARAFSCPVQGERGGERRRRLFVHRQQLCSETQDLTVVLLGQSTLLPELAA